MREEVPLSTDGTVRNLVSARRARVGDYKETTDVLLNADYVWFPPAFGSRIGLDAFARWNLTRGSFEPGLGVFITQPNAPTRVVGGLSVSSVDGDLNVGLISGFNF